MVETQIVENPAELREQLFMDLYKSCFPVVARSIAKFGGSFDEAKDVFQDALVIFYEKQSSGKLELRVSEKAYLFGIARNLWLHKYKEKNKRTGLDEHTDVFEETEAGVSQQLLLRYLEVAGKKCMELLKSFYYDNEKLETIADQFGFSGTRSATVQKYKCLEKVREKVKEKSLAYEDFLD